MRVPTKRRYLSPRQEEIMRSGTELERKIEPLRQRIHSGSDVPSQGRVERVIAPASVELCARIRTLSYDAIQVSIPRT